MTWTTHNQVVPGPRILRLPKGAALAVRPVTPTDADGLAALYECLDVGDRYRRFFSGYRPQPDFFDRLARSDQPGEFRLVAVRSNGKDEIVGEAGYTPLADGNGELAMTVAKGWRGWLGPYLLDQLLDAARERGIPNLEADILVTNAPMLALVRGRGYAVVDRPDATVIRVMIGTEGPMPSWPGSHNRPRILVETPGARWHAQEAAQRAGMQVLVCPGPQARCRCPAVDGNPCPLAGGADVIVMSHAPSDPRWNALRAAHRTVHHGVAVYIEERRGDRAEVVRSVRQLLPVTFDPGETPREGAQIGSDADVVAQRRM